MLKQQKSFDFNASSNEKRISTLVKNKDMKGMHNTQSLVGLTASTDQSDQLQMILKNRKQQARKSTQGIYQKRLGR